MQYTVFERSGSSEGECGAFCGRLGWLGTEAGGTCAEVLGKRLSPSSYTFSGFVGFFQAVEHACSVRKQARKSSTHKLAIRQHSQAHSPSSLEAQKPTQAQLPLPQPPRTSSTQIALSHLFALSRRRRVCSPHCRPGGECSPSC